MGRPTPGIIGNETSWHKDDNCSCGRICCGLFVGIIVVGGIFLALYFTGVFP